MAKHKEKVMSFGEHLEELRRRLIISLWGILPILLLSFYFGKDILGFLIEPIIIALHESNLGGGLQATGPLESFMTYFKVVLTVTFLVSSPWILYQAWLFVAPGLYSNERRFAYILAPLSFLLTVTGVSFCYKIMLPVTLFFLATFGADIKPFPPKTAPVEKDVSFGFAPILAADPPEPAVGQMWVNDEFKQLRICTGIDAEKKPHIMMLQLSGGGMIAQQYRLSEYVSLLLGFCLAFALSFQLPVVVLLLGWAGLVEVAMLGRYRKYAVFGCVVLSTIITPTQDPFTMMLLAGPLYLLYELGILLLRVLPAKRVAEGFGGGARTDGNEGGDA